MATSAPAPGRSQSPRKHPSVVLEPLLLRAVQAADVCGASVRTWRIWDTTGKIPQPIRIGRVTFWRYDELRAWAAAGCPDRAGWEASRQ